MEQTLKLYVKLTLEDIKQLSYTKIGPKTILAKISLGFRLLMLIPVIRIIYILAPFIVINIFILIPFLGLIFIIIGSDIISVISAMLFYLQHKRYCIENNLFKKPNCYEFTETGIELTSEPAVTFIRWNNIKSINEYKSCFTIQLHSTITILVPRRCFENEEQLKMFLDILAVNVDKNKFKLKDFKIKLKSSYEHDKPLSSINLYKDNEEGKQSLFEITFSYEKSDLLNFYLYILCKTPKNIIFTLFSASLIFIFGRARLLYGPNLIVEMFLVIGIFFMIFPFTISYYNAERISSKQIIRSCKFYLDKLKVTGPDNVMNYKWTEFIKIKQNKSAYLLYITKSQVFILPKRLFINRKNEQAIFEEIISNGR